MNKYIIIKFCLLSLHLQLQQIVYAQNSSSTVREQTIKHELARMPEQASWTIERWNINDVDFELKEVSKATRNTSAKFKLEVNIPGKSTSKLKNILSQGLGDDKFKVLTVYKNNLLYKTEIKYTDLATSYWSVGGYQVLYLSRGDLVRQVKKSDKNYQNYRNSDFSGLEHLFKEEHFKGEVITDEGKYWLYHGDIEVSRLNKEFKLREEGMKIERPEDWKSYQQALASGLNCESFLLIDQKTQLPTYYCDAISLYLFKYPSTQERREFVMPEAPAVVQKNIQWYIENVVPEM